MDQSAVDWVPTLGLGSTISKSTVDVVDQNISVEPLNSVTNFSASFSHGADSIINGNSFWL